MIKNILLIIALSTSFLFFTTGISAQGQEAVNQRKVCLDPLRCSEGTNAGKCSGQFVENWSHRARLDIRQSSPPLTNVPTYVIECIALSHVSGGGTVCTTGSAATDTQLGYETDGVANATYLRSEDRATFIFYGMFKDGVEELQNPIPAGTNFNWLEWEDFTDVHATQKQFLAINFYRPSAPDAPVELTEQEKKSLQQATLRFLQTQVDPSETNCLEVFYDPYGKVFDSQTLDPISGASVTLMRQRDSGEFTRLTSAELRGGVIKNPQTTAEDGSYFFPIPDGDYKLFVSHPSFTFPIEEVNLNTNWASIYSDIYPLKTGEVITQKGAIQHRDIPLNPKFPQPAKAPDFMSYFYENAGAGKISLRGATTNAFTTLTFYSRKKELSSEQSIRNRQILKIDADKEGKFKAVIDTKDFEPGEYFGEVDLQRGQTSTGASLLGSPQNTKPVVTTVVFEPVPSYLEGTIYNASGLAVPNAKVSFLTPHSSIPVGSVIADEKGLIIATTDQLPTSNFVLVVTPPTGATFEITPADFIVQNTKYLAEKKISMYTTKLSDLAQAQLQKDTKKPSIAPSKEQRGSFYNPFNPSSQTKDQSNVVNQSSGTMFAILLGVLVIFGAIAIGGLVYYSLKLKSQNQ